LTVRFKVLASVMPFVLEEQLNEWAAALPPGTKIRRTQLAARESGWAALVSYELPAGAAAEDGGNAVKEPGGGRPPSPPAGTVGRWGIFGCTPEDPCGMGRCAGICLFVDGPSENR